MNADQNIADFIFFTMYSLLNGIFEDSFVGVMAGWRNGIQSILYIAMALIGYKLIYPSKDSFSKSIKSLIVIMMVFIFINNPRSSYDVLKTAFIEIPVEAGNKTIGAMASAMNGVVNNSSTQNQSSAPEITGEKLQFNPQENSRSAFGALWLFSTSLADRLFKEGGIRNFHITLAGAVLYLVAVAMLVFQILVMATALILSAACILAAPLFCWMVLFKPTRNMFEKWIGMGLTGGVMLYLMVVVLGIIIAFMSVVVGSMMGYDLFNPSGTDTTSEDFVFKAKQFMASIIFMWCAVKLIPKVDTWGASLGGFAAHGLLEGAVGASGMLADKFKQLSLKGASASKDALSKPSNKDDVDNNDDPKNELNLRDYQLQSRIDSAATENLLSDDREPAMLEKTNDPNELSSQEKPPQSLPPASEGVDATFDFENQREPVHANTSNQSGEVNQHNEIRNEARNESQENNDVRNDVDITNEDGPDIDESSNDEETASRNEAMMHFEQMRTEEEIRDSEEAAENRKQTQKLHDIEAQTKDAGIAVANQSGHDKPPVDAEQTNNDSAPGRLSDKEFSGTGENPPASDKGSEKNEAANETHKRKESEELKKDDE